MPSTTATSGAGIFGTSLRNPNTRTTVDSPMTVVSPSASPRLRTDGEEVGRVEVAVDVEPEQRLELADHDDEP